MHKHYLLDKNDMKILREGTFIEQSNLLMNHWDDVTDIWLKKARDYFRKYHKIGLGGQDEYKN